MHIGIDGNEANIKHRVGSNIFAYEVLRQLSTLGESDFFDIYLRDKPLPDFPAEKTNWHYKIFGPKKMWTQLALPIKLFLQNQKPAVFFTPGHYAPRYCPVPSVITILDTSYLTFPQYFRKQDLYQLKSWSAYSVKNARKIITISHSTKKDLIKHYQVSDDKIAVIYPGYDKKKFDPALDLNKNDELLKKYQITTPYLLFVGTIQPRKNIQRLLSAFRQLVNGGFKINLVIAGKVGWLYDDILRMAKEKENDSAVIVTGYVEDNDLPYLYKNASCFVLPSLYEGFGIPAVEAMSMECPVVVSNISSLPEIVGDAGILIDPYSVEDIKNGLMKALTLKPEEKESMIKKGREQADKFSWDKCAREILSILKSC